MPINSYQYKYTDLQLFWFSSHHLKNFSFKFERKQEALEANLENPNKKTPFKGNVKAKCEAVLEKKPLK